MSLFPHISRPAPKPPTVTIGGASHVYPCDRGTGSPQGWHYYQAAPTVGLVVCVFCGKRAPEGATR